MDSQTVFAPVNSHPPLQGESLSFSLLLVNEWVSKAIRVMYLSGICGLVYCLISNVEIQVIHPLHHSSLGLVSDLGRLFDGDT